ncbi:hypothetical protein FQA39_LY18841 [Lamprigera yunnana]|nr:hypothetical protein FQA39_LY18841 [Lamprigera yunnana]
MSVRKQNRILEEFIATYRSEPCLWRIKSREYHDRDVREAAYDRLITKLKEIEPDANKSSVVKKINNFRSNVRKKKKKRDMSRKSGAGTDNVYSPKLWYFDLFDFLGDHDVPSTSSSNLDDEDVSEMDEEGTEGTIQQTPLIEEVSEQTIVTPNHRTRPEKEKLQAPLHPNIGKKRKSEELTNDVLVSVRDHFKKPPPQDDRYDLMGVKLYRQKDEVRFKKVITEERKRNFNESFTVAWDDVIDVEKEEDINSTVLRSIHQSVWALMQSDVAIFQHNTICKCLQPVNHK